jgi:hypothetical protein
MWQRSCRGCSVPDAYVHWVPPSACYNRVGYYEVPNPRVVYRLHGSVASFGIASLTFGIASSISWRGVRYVVHLGAAVRSRAGGAVDDPSSGPEISAPPPPAETRLCGGRPG